MITVEETIDLRQRASLWLDLKHGIVDMAMLAASLQHNLACLSSLLSVETPVKHRLPLPISTNP